MSDFGPAIFASNVYNGCILVLEIQPVVLGQVVEEYVEDSAGIDRPWQGELCQFFTRADVARLCLQRIDLPRNLSFIRLLEPAAGQGAFILPLIQRLVRNHLKLGKPPEALADNIR